MFINSFNERQVSIYAQYISRICSLSKLFSESNIPFLHYKIAENIFCKSFQAENISTADIAYDAKLHSMGIGLKTFISSHNKSREKIAEFNAHSQNLKKLCEENLVKELSHLRNERITFANRVYGIKKGVYHCLARQENKIHIFETEYNLIDINSIKNITSTQSSVFFEDSNGEYSYNFSKSTLYFKFYTPPDSFTIPIQIIKDPYDLLLKIFNHYKFEEQKELEYVIVPLYSTRNKKDKIVPNKSGLNQWNSGGRKRDLGEVYIPVPRQIHTFFPDFFSA